MTAKKKPLKKAKPVKKVFAKKPTTKKVDPWKKAVRYLGVKFVDAFPMTRGAYNIMRGWTIPADENPKDPGYTVRYPDGYISWCPKVQFEAANRQCEGLSFGHAIEAAKKGFKIARAGWNGKGMWVIYVSGTKKAVLKPGTPYAVALGRRKTVEILPHFDMFTADKKMLPGWLASQSDMDAQDWCIVK